MSDILDYTVCFFGHRFIDESEELRRRLCKTIEDLIQNRQVSVFLFGSKSRFDDLCYKTVSELMEKYSYIKRIYVRAEFPFINEDYRNYLLEGFEDTYYSERMIKSGRAAYVERNREMIDKSRFCVFYYDESYTPPKRKSGTKIAYDYAAKKKREIINVI